MRQFVAKVDGFRAADGMRTAWICRQIFISGFGAKDCPDLEVFNPYPSPDR